MCSDVAALALVNAALLSIGSFACTKIIKGDWTLCIGISIGAFGMALTIILQCLWRSYHG